MKLELSKLLKHTARLFYDKYKLGLILCELLSYAFPYMPIDDNSAVPYERLQRNRNIIDGISYKNYIYVAIYLEKRKSSVDLVNSQKKTLTCSWTKVCCFVIRGFFRKQGYVSPFSPTYLILKF